MPLGTSSIRHLEGTKTAMPSFFSAALSTWRATHAPLPGAMAEPESLDAVVKLSIKALPDARTADTLGADRFTRAVTWILATDDELRRFLTDAGWAPDGAHRELDLDGTGSTTVRQVRLHTAL